MTNIHIFSGFLGAGKTTLIKKLLSDGFQGEKVVLIENEFGEVGIDGGFLKEIGIEIKEMNSGCICCSLVGDFSASLMEVMERFHPDRILIEPSGVGKLSDVIQPVKALGNADINLKSYSTVVDATKCKVYLKNFGEFYKNQIQNADTILLSRTEKVSDSQLENCVKLLRENNKDARIVTTVWENITGEQILNAIEHKDSLEQQLMAEQQSNKEGCKHHEHKHHGHEHGEGCGCHEHEHGEGCGCHEHEHGESCGHHGHEHGEGCGCHEHEHGEGCGHHRHGHKHGAHHHADEVFTSWGTETPKKFTEEELGKILESFSDEEKYGKILRAKGIISEAGGEWLYFDFVPGEYEIRKGSPDYTGRVCIIGVELKEDNLKELF